jgi:hypothetical protein
VTRYWKDSRILKALTDGGHAGSFKEAEHRLRAVRIEVRVGDDQRATPAGQAAVLTAVATARKCFGQVTLVADGDAPLIAPLPLGGTLLKAARRLGAKVAMTPSTRSTHVIRIGNVVRSNGWDLRCWWHRWFIGTRAWDDDAVGDSRLALAGVFSGALAIRQVFASVLAGKALRERDATVSLWMPWAGGDQAENGPAQFDLPDKIWFLGLGHLGQAFVWNLCFLSTSGERRAVLQDDQKIGDENEATSLLVVPGRRQIGERKTRLARLWLEACGWQTELIERRHHGDIRLSDDDPPFLLSGLDHITPRLTMARHGFPFMIDAGIGHGPGDFEGIQVRVIANGQPIDGLWEEPQSPETADQDVSDLLVTPAYLELETHVGNCGVVAFAEASVAVPFVGAATGALAIAQVIRLASMSPAPLFLQMELSSPEMTTIGYLTEAPLANLGCCTVRL